MLYRAVVFDLDGTLINTLTDLTNATNHALTHFGYPERTLEEVRLAVGNGLINLVRRTVPESTSEERCEEVLAELNAYYAQHCQDFTAPYPGVSDLMRKLIDAGVGVAVVSNKADYAVQELVPHYFEGLFNCCVGERKGIRRKPAPDSTNEVLRQLGISAEDAIYVGDSDVDIQTAKAAGMSCISVTWGFRSAEFLAENGATTLVDTPEELEKMLLD